MKFLRFLLAFLTLGFILSACQKDFSFEAGNAKGALAKDASGDCVPSLVNGNYFKDSGLNATNYVDVQVDMTKVGVYTIKTDTVNGYSFTATGSTGVLGPNTIRLIGSGKPLATGFDAFTVKFDGSSCEFNVVVNMGTGGGGTNAIFTYPNTGAACTGATQTTNFFATLPTNATTHFITLSVNVTQAGTYNLGTTTTNGLTFTAIGSFTATGPQSLILSASGIPTAAGTISYMFSTTTPVASSCAFDLTVQAAPAPAAFTFNCAAVTTQGTYQVGTAMTAANTMTVPITVTAGGSYNITTTVNGVTFAGANVLPATPAAQTIILNATGTGIAAASPSTIFTLSGGGGASCAVTVPFTAAPTPATFTFNCASVTTAGTYQVGTAMTAANTMTVPITVTAGGTYNISTTAVNGVTFAGNGTLPAAPASQTITLTATGMPTATAAPSTVFSLSGGGGANCAVTIPFTAASTSFIRGRIGSAAAPLVTFNNNISGLNDLTIGQTLGIGGDGTGMEDFGITVSNISGLLAINTDYNVNQLLTTFILVDGGYTNAAGTVFSATSGLTPQLVRPFTVRFSTISANRLVGTFSGNMDDGAGGIVAFYGGEFDVTF